MDGKGFIPFSLTFLPFIPLTLSCRIVLIDNPSYGLSALKTKETRHPRAGGGPGDWVTKLDSWDSWIPAFAGMTAFLLVYLFLNPVARVG